MRSLLLFPLLLAAAACSRAPAPAKPGSVALPPAANASVAQVVPAGSTPQPAAETTVAGDGPAAASLKPAPGARPADSFGQKAPGGDDPRWRNVDPNQLPVVSDPALAEFQAEQRRRDAELLQRDADEAEVVRDDPRYREDPRQDEDARYREDPREDDRFEGDRYGDGRYDELPPELPPDERDFEEPPYYEGDEEFDPEMDEGYDPREDEGYYRPR